MRLPIARYAAVTASLYLCACSSLKMASLQDARVLPPGGFALSVEIASAYYQNNALIQAGHERDTALAGAWSRDTTVDYFNAHMVPLAGASLALGTGGGWELGLGAGFSPLSEEAWVVDGYAKKRVYTDGNGGFVSLYGRLSYGSVVGYLNLNGESWFYRNDYRYSTRTAELDFQAMYLGRLARKLGYYFNAGPSIGKIDYELDGREGRNDASGSLPIYGLRLHAGMVFELRRFELAWETGLQTFNYGMTPSLGVRACFKTDWRR